MKIDMVRRRASWFEEADWALIIMIGMIILVLGIALVGGTFGLIDHFAQKDAARIQAQVMTTATESLAKRFKGKRVVVDGFEEVGLVMGNDENKLHVYFPTVGVVYLEGDVLRVVGEDPE